MNNIELDEIDAVVLNNKLPRFNVLAYYKEKKLFINMYFIYRKLFTEYMIELLDLKKYDDEIKASIYKFLTISKDNADFYQAFSDNFLNYIYIRNNIFIENLNIEEFNYLKSLINRENIQLDEPLKNFIEKTYKKVIFQDLLNNGEICMTFYGPQTSAYCTTNDSLVIGFRYDEFNLNNMNDFDWNINHNNQVAFLDKLFYKIKSDISKRISIPIEIIKYNEFSTTKKLKK